jgi:hypothetical protein
VRAIVNYVHLCGPTTSFRRVEVKRSLLELAEIELRKESGEKLIDLLLRQLRFKYQNHKSLP